MNPLSERQRREVTDLLTEKPFECDHVFFFCLEQGKLNPLDDESAGLYDRFKATLDTLPSEPLKGWPGNIVAGPRDANLARFYASYRFGVIMLVLSKIVSITPGEHVLSPFNKYFLDAVSASVSRLIAPPNVRRPEHSPEALTQQETIEFKELIAWRECKNLWRRKYGPDKWLAIKGGQPVAQASTLDELGKAVQQLGIEPPVLFAAPEGEERTSEVPLAVRT